IRRSRSGSFSRAATTAAARSKAATTRPAATRRCARPKSRAKLSARRLNTKGRLWCSRSEPYRSWLSRSRAPVLCFEHDLFRKPVPTFRDHALVLREQAKRLRWQRNGELLPLGHGKITHCVRREVREDRDLRRGFRLKPGAAERAEEIEEGNLRGDL